MTPSLGKRVSGVFDLSLAAVFLMTWLDPDGGLARSVAFLLLMMLMEFITIHSSAMLGSVWMGPGDRDRRLRTVVGLIAMYGLFAGGFSLGFSTWAPFLGFWFLTANRLMGMLLGGRPTEAVKNDAERQWARSVFLFVVGAFATTFLPVPRLGLTVEAMTAIDIPGSGLWVSEPWRVVAFGAAYFGLGGIMQLRDGTRREESALLTMSTGD